MKEKPLSDRAEIIRMMNDGWELGWFQGIRRELSYFQLQNPGLMRGGETRRVHRATAHKMDQMELIRVVKRKGDPFWLQRYELTEREAKL